MSVESLGNIRQECESLREELRVLSEKLLKQHDAALESQVLKICFSSERIVWLFSVSFYYIRFIYSYWKAELFIIN